MHQPVAAQNNADFDGDGTVGFADFLAFAGHTLAPSQGDGRYQAKYDLNSDGMIDIQDFISFTVSFFSTVPPSSGSESVFIPDVDLRAVISRQFEKGTRGTDHTGQTWRH